MSKPLPRLTDQHCMTIIIVGTFTKGQFDPRIDLLLDKVKQALDETLPDFVPARNPVTVNVAQLAEKA